MISPCIFKEWVCTGTDGNVMFLLLGKDQTNPDMNISVREVAGFTDCPSVFR